MKFANLPRETKIVLMDEQSALSKIREKLELIGRNITKITKHTKFRTHVIFEQKSILLTILVKYPLGTLSHFAVMIGINEVDEIKNMQNKMLESIKKINEK